MSRRFLTANLIVTVLLSLGFVPGLYQSGLVQAAGGFFDSVSNFANSVGDVMDDVLTKAEKVIYTIQTWESVISEAIEADCEFECENGAKPKPNPDFVIPQPNGCGSLGLSYGKDALPLKELSKCCDRHDVCYDSCNNEKDDCDRVFKECLYHICDRYKTKIGEVQLKKCKGAAKFMFTSTVALGCKSYKDAQKKACLCDNMTHPDL